MVISKSFLERRRSRPSSSAFGVPNMWYQSKLGRPLRRRQQYDFIQRQLRREKEAQFGTCIRQITQDCKEMLRKKMEEIELYNSTINQPYSNNILQNRHNRYKCFKCRQRGHVMKNCRVKKHDEGKQETGNTSETAKEINEGFMTTKPTSFGGYLSVYFAREFGKIGEILRLSGWRRKKGKEYTCPAFHQCDFGDNQAPNKEAASTKGKEKIEHFGIILEDARRDEDSHQIQPISPNIKRSQTKDKDLQGMIKTSINSDKTDTNSSSSDDFTIIA
ncbi:ARID DNA-binding domain-containing protein [Tanacetum coccineum]